jgi:hypothetical protein
VHVPNTDISKGEFRLKKNDSCAVHQIARQLFHKVACPFNTRHVNGKNYFFLNLICDGAMVSAMNSFMVFESFLKRDSMQVKDHDI